MLRGFTLLSMPGCGECLKRLWRLWLPLNCPDGFQCFHGGSNRRLQVVDGVDVRRWLSAPLASLPQRSGGSGWRQHQPTWHVGAIAASRPGCERSVRVDYSSGFRRRGPRRRGRSGGGRTECIDGRVHMDRRVARYRRRAVVRHPRRTLRLAALASSLAVAVRIGEVRGRAAHLSARVRRARGDTRVRAEARHARRHLSRSVRRMHEHGGQRAVTDRRVAREFERATRTHDGHRRNLKGGGNERGRTVTI
jgi:hypothetical protein